ncbi:MAG: hypothetical protein AAF447_26590, partial [Myxococcota bacterium]
FRDLPSNFDLVVASLVSPQQWDDARAADKVMFGELGKKGRCADIPSVPEQDKLSRNVETESKALRPQVTALRTALTDVLGWAGVDANESARAKTLAALEAQLIELSDRKSAFDRVEALAGVGADVEVVKSFGLLLSKLEKEAQALERFDGQRLAFEQVEAHGTEKERHDVVLALRNRLKAPTTSSLSDLASTWPDLARSTFQEILKRRSPEPDPDEEKKRQERLKEEAEERAKREAELKAKQEQLDRERAELAAQQERVKLLENAKVHQVTVAEAKRSAAELLAEELERFADDESVEIQFVVRKRSS